MFKMAELLFRTFKDVSLRVMGLTLERVKLQEQEVSTMLEEMDDDEDLQLHTTSDFKVDHVDAYDSDCDDEATMEYIEHIVSDNDTCDALTCDSNVISYADYMFIPKVVEKNDLSKTVTSHLHTNKKIIKKCTKVLAPTLLKIELEPINAYFKNNRVVHQDYLRVTKEHMETLQELLEEARALKPLDEHIGRVSYINASGSQHRSNTKKDRIQRPSSRSKKNKVEAQHRKFKSSSNKNNHVSDCNANIKNVALSKNSENICLSCNECLFSANHDACVVKYLKNVE
ncbi:hypothetical protein Tco_0660975 [Tanacetum coccineum]